MPAPQPAPARRIPGPPDAAYLDLLITAARGHGFPQWYLERLEGHRAAAQA